MQAWESLRLGSPLPGNRCGCDCTRSHVGMSTKVVTGGSGQVVPALSAQGHSKTAERNTDLQQFQPNVLENCLTDFYILLEAFPYQWDVSHFPLFEERILSGSRGMPLHSHHLSCGPDVHIHLEERVAKCTPYLVGKCRSSFSVELLVVFLLCS